MTVGVIGSERQTGGGHRIALMMINPGTGSSRSVAQNVSSYAHAINVLTMAGDGSLETGVVKGRVQMQQFEQAP
ncbi:MAG: hypothetical protein ACI8PZ_007414 [Myxococcota bacterium]|jgi:hypothetical protein